jgi:hypothetical protein
VSETTFPSSGSNGEHVRAEHVEISQGGASTIDATTVNLQQGGVGSIRATDVSVSQGGVGLARTGNLRLEGGASAFAVVADDATIGEGSSVLMLIARQTSGDVQPLLDWRAAAAFGMGLGLVMRLLRRR